MQTNDFEKRVQAELDQFKVVPGEEVWQHVAARIGKEKRRRRFFTWFFSALLLVTAGAGLWQYQTGTFRHTEAPKETGISIKNNQQQPQPATSTTKKTIAPGSASVTPGVKQDTKREVFTPNAATPEPTHLNDDVLLTGVRRTNINPEGTNAAKANLPVTAPQDKPLASIPQSEIEAAQVKTEKNIPANAPRTTTDVAANKITAAGAWVEKRDATAKGEDPVVTLNTPAKPLITSDTTFSGDDTRRAVNDKLIKNNRWKTRVEVFSGFSNNVNGVALTSGQLLRQDMQSPSANSGNSPSTVVQKIEYRPKISGGVGVAFEKALSQRLNIAVGVSYHYYAVSTTVGDRKDSIANVSDFLLNNSRVVYSYYRPGQSTTVGNHYHLLSLPVEVLYRLNRNRERPLQLGMGISPAYLVGSKAIYFNRTQRSFYREDEQFKKFQLLLQASVHYPVITGKSIKLNVGPVMHYGLSNLTRPQTNTKEHLFFLGIKTGLSF